jgi:hypothetical protein
VAFALLALWSLQAAVPSPSASNEPAPTQVEGPALIRNSGSSNTQPYTIAVRPDGSAVVTVGSAAPEDRRLPAGQAADLFAELRAAGPLATLAHAHCMYSASFGTRTTVTFGGATTPDLSCGAGPGTQALAGTVMAIVDGLHLAVMRGNRAPVLP